MQKSTDRRRFVKGMAIGATGIVATGASPVVRRPGREFLAHFGGIFERAAELNMAFAEKMPADLYDFRPVPEIRSYAEQLLHVAGTNGFIVGEYLLGSGAPEIDFEPEDPTKEMVIDLMKKSDAFVSSSVEGLSNEEMDVEVETFAGMLRKEDVCWFLRDHMTHHRGQMIVYLRLNGMEPPQYVGW